MIERPFSRTSYVNLQRGTIIKVAVKGGRIAVGEITYVSTEQGKIIYDYTDQYGNFLWCYADQILEVIR